MLTLERIEPRDRDVQRLAGFADRVLFQTPEWGRALTRTEDAERVEAAVLQDGETVGYFTGYVVRKFGVRILGSPLRGWSTWYMGFNLEPGVSHGEALRALTRFAFRELGCLHLEVRDRHLPLEEARASGLRWAESSVWEIDLTPSEDELWASFSSACRRCVRKAEKSGVAVEEAAPGDPSFAEDYYRQLEDVYAKQSLVPPHGIERVRAIVEELPDTLLLRARDPDGRCIATALFPAAFGVAYYWGGASWREHQILRPNEALMWHALRYWKRRGMTACDLGGGHAQYKTKYAPRLVPISFVHESSYRGLWALRTAAWHAYHAQRRLRGRLRAGRD